MLCFVKGNIRLVSHDLGPVVSTHLEKSLAFSQRPGAGKTKINNATFFLMPGQGKSKLGEKNLYLSFSFMFMEQENKGVWWPIWDCEWKMPSINLHS